MSNHVKFSQLMYEKIIATEQHSAKSIARKTGTSLSTLYKYCEGGYNPPAEFVTKIYNATGDVDFLNFILNDTDKILVDKPKGKKEKSLVEEALDIAAADGKVIMLIKEALQDKVIPPSGKSAIRAAINEAHKELQDVIHALEE